MNGLFFLWIHKCVVLWSIEYSVYEGFDLVKDFV